MKYIINNDGETPRKQKLENSNSEEVRGFQKTDENRAIWENGHETGAQYGIELTVFELMKGIRKKYPLFGQHIQFDADDTFKAIPEIVRQILSGLSLLDPLFEGIEKDENPDGGMEERERELAEAIEENALVERVTSTLTTLEGLEGKDD